MSRIAYSHRAGVREEQYPGDNTESPDLLDIILHGQGLG